jgi:hypothetical protein
MYKQSLRKKLKRVKTNIKQQNFRKYAKITIFKKKQNPKNT